MGRVEVGRRASEFRPSVDGYPASQVYGRLLGGHEDRTHLKLRRNKSLIYSLLLVASVLISVRSRRL